MSNENVFERIASTSAQLAKELSILKNDILSNSEKSEVVSIVNTVCNAICSELINNSQKEVFKDIIYEPIYSLKSANEILNSKPDINNGLQLPIFLHFSDIHKDVQRLENLLIFAKSFEVDAVFFTGDYVSENGTEDISEMLAVQNKFKDIPFYFCLGNHEQVGINNNQIMYEKFLLPFAEWNIYNFPKENVGYYYSDIEKFKLRIICLHQNCVARGHSMGYSQEQVDWFIRTLKSAPLEYGIIVLRHSCEQLPRKINTMSSFFANISDNISHWITEGVTDSIVDAFISRSIINKEVADCSINSQRVTLTGDFTAVDQSIEFIGFLDGHNHTDYIGYVRNTTNKILDMNICCAAMKNGASYWYSYNDYKRRLNTFTEDLFNIFSINRKEKMVHITRPGNAISFDLRERKHLSIPYA